MLASSPSDFSAPSSFRPIAPAPPPDCQMPTREHGLRLNLLMKGPLSGSYRGYDTYAAMLNCCITPEIAATVATQKLVKAFHMDALGRTNTSLRVVLLLQRLEYSTDLVDRVGSESYKVAPTFRRIQERCYVADMQDTVGWDFMTCYIEQQRHDTLSALEQPPQLYSNTLAYQIRQMGPECDIYMLHRYSPIHTMYLLESTSALATHNLPRFLVGLYIDSNHVYCGVVDLPSNIKNITDISGYYQSMSYRNVEEAGITSTNGLAFEHREYFPGSIVLSLNLSRDAQSADRYVRYRVIFHIALVEEGQTGAAKPSGGLRELMGRFENLKK